MTMYDNECNGGLRSSQAHQFVTLPQVVQIVSWFALIAALACWFVGGPLNPALVRGVCVSCRWTSSTWPCSRQSLVIVASGRGLCKPPALLHCQLASNKFSSLQPVRAMSPNAIVAFLLVLCTQASTWSSSLGRRTSVICLWWWWLSCSSD
jgi:hypothetical protein